MSKISVPAYAKINLSLRILNKRADGYHDLDTIFQTISLHDTIKITPKDNSEITLSSNDPRLPTDETNLVIRAAKSLRHRFATTKGAHLRLDKRIPIQGGLGGGSADAAVTLLALAHLWRLPATRQDLIGVGSQIGADVPYFFLGGTARGAGVGDKLAPLPDAPEQFLLIIKPNANTRTSEAYQALDARSLTTRNSKTILSSSPTRERFDSRSFASLENDFEEVIFALEPEIARAKTALMRAGATAAALAGSGSSVFAIFDSEDAQRRAIQAIELETGWRVFPCKTVGRDDYLSAFGDLRQRLA